MKLKGQATFELTNVETGEKRVIKEENMVTNAFKYLVQSPGTGIGGPYTLNKLGSSDNGSYNSTMSGTNHITNPTKHYTNGLLLFADALEEDEDHIFVTSQDPSLTAVGSEVAYSGNQTCAGSYNVNESGAIEGGYKHVWDFTTHQGNGDIGCACLTTLANGGMGNGLLPTRTTDWWGALSSEVGTTTIKTYYNLKSFDDYPQDSAHRAKGYIDIGRNLFIRPKKYYSMPYYDGGSSSSRGVGPTSGVTRKVFMDTFIYTKSIELDIFRFPHSNWSIFDNGVTKSRTIYYGSSSSSVSEGQYKLIDTVTVNMPQGLIDLIPDDIVQASLNTAHYWPTAINYDEGFMYITFIIPTGSGSNGAKLLSGGKLYTWKIDMNTFESDYFVITNTTGQDISGFIYASSRFMSAFATMPNFIVCNDYTVIIEEPYYTQGKMWIIDNATGTTIKQVTDTEGNVLTFSDTYPRYIVNNMLYMTSTVSTSSGTGYFGAINLATGVHTRGSFRSAYQGYSGNTVGFTRTFGTQHHLIASIEQQVSSGTSYWSAIHLSPDPHLLMTINNLETKVTKTTAETMKVTYTLIEVE